MGGAVPVAEMRDLAVRWGARTVLEEIDLQLLPGERLAVVVTGALQTPTGRMVFGRLDGAEPTQDPAASTTSGAAPGASGNASGPAATPPRAGASGGGSGSGRGGKGKSAPKRGGKGDQDPASPR